MTHEPHDTKAEAAAYRQDLQQQREAHRIAQAEANRRAWAQRNGNDSGFDPYADIQD